MSVHWKAGRAYDVYRDPITKKQKWVKLYARTEREAQQEADVLKGERIKRLRANEFDPLTPRDIPWAELVEKYLSIGEGDGNCAATLFRKKLHFQHINRILGIKMTSEWSVEVLEDFKKRCLRAGDAPGVINKELGIIKGVLRLARRLKYAAPSSDDVRDVKQVRNNAPEPVFYTDEDQAKILDIASPFWRVATMLGGFAGVRLGEALNIRWQDIDFVKKRMHIVDRPDWRTKTRRSNTVPLHADLVQALTEWRAANPNAIMVLPWKTDTNEFGKAFKRLVKRAGLSGSYKSLRHGLGTALMQQDVNSMKIRDILGHASVKTTEKYAHVRARDLGEVIDRLPSPMRLVKNPSNISSNKTPDSGQHQQPSTAVPLEGGD